jgi:flagellar motor switch protein FliN
MSDEHKAKDTQVQEKTDNGNQQSITGGSEEQMLSSAASRSSALPSPGLPANLALLLDAELEATIRFGRREIPLKEILGLGPGDVVELDQRVDEPAQLIVAGRTIAKGEVVVVDGNFGLRITEVASASQRAEAVRV